MMHFSQEQKQKCGFQNDANAIPHHQIGWLTFCCRYGHIWQHERIRKWHLGIGWNKLFKVV